MNAIAAELAIAGLLALAAGLIGASIDTAHATTMSTSMLVALGLFLLRQFWMIGKLLRWADSELGTPTPSAGGIWDRVFNALQRRSRQARSEHDELAGELTRFRRASEALPDGVIILDGFRVIEWLNPRAEICLGLKASTDIGMQITHLLRDPGFLAYLENTNPRLATLELRPQRNPGRTLQIQRMALTAGRLLLLVRDITQLEKLGAMRRDFVANVSHELKTPLTVVLGFIETTLDVLADQPSQEVTGYLQTAADQARRMQHLVEDLLTLSTLETDAPAEEMPLDVHELLRELCREAEMLSTGQHAIHLSLEGAPVQLLGNRRELHSALGNLSSNAVRYTPAGGDIHMHWRLTASGEGCFSVTDNGIGIEAAHVPRLTERFYRVDAGRSRNAGGTGLGLAIVKHVLERHQAHLLVDSAPGKGSCFSVLFPPQRIQKFDE